MQIVKKYICLICLLTPFFVNGQKIPEELVKWDSERKLSWSDYKGKPDPSSDAAASTSTSLGINYGISAEHFTYKIKCSLSKNKSWVRYKSDYVLSHEQGHFDITEIFARKLNKMMSEYKFDKNNYRHDLDKIYQNIIDEKDAFQDRYDIETDFSRNKVKQAEWLMKIAKMLEELKEYSDY